MRGGAGVGGWGGSGAEEGTQEQVQGPQCLGIGQARGGEAGAPSSPAGSVGRWEVVRVC